MIKIEDLIPEKTVLTCCHGKSLVLAKLNNLVFLSCNNEFNNPISNPLHISKINELFEIYEEPKEEEIPIPIGVYDCLPYVLKEDIDVYNGLILEGTEILITSTDRYGLTFLLGEKIYSIFIMGFKVMPSLIEKHKIKC